MSFEYKVVPAPTRGIKAKGVKSPADRFARALSEAINAEAAEGWEYLRTDTLPAEVRQGLTGRSTVFQNMLVFRRSADQAEVSAPEDNAPELTAISATDVPSVSPKLPSADQAQEIPERVEAVAVTGAERRDMAAE